MDSTTKRDDQMYILKVHKADDGCDLLALIDGNKIRFIGSSVKGEYSIPCGNRDLYLHHWENYINKGDDHVRL